jgi:ABC-type polysaccharide/polyol phosphate export permease
MGWSDFFLKYRGSVLGYLWSFLAPLSKFLVIFYVFQPLVGSAIPHYPLYLLAGIIIWEHFALTTVSCMGMLREKASLIQQVLFPRLLLILTVGWTNLLVFFTYLIIFIMFALFLHIPLSAGLLYLPLLFLQMTLLALGIGMLLSAYSLKYQDVPHLWGIVLQVLFWLTPVTYALTRTGPLINDALNVMSHPPQLSLSSVFWIFSHFQPLSILIDDTRRSLIPDSARGIPSIEHMLGFTLLCAAIFVLGAFIFNRRSRFFLEEY